MPKANGPVCQEKNCRKLAVCEIKLLETILPVDETRDREAAVYSFFYCAQHANEFLYKSEDARTNFEKRGYYTSARVWLLS